MKWCRFVCIGTKYHLGDVIIIRSDGDCSPIVITCESSSVCGAKGRHLRTGTRAVLNSSCTDVSTIVPPEHWDDEICVLMAKHALECRIDFCEGS